MQNKVRFGTFDEVQPTKFSPNFASTSTEDSGRTIDGKMHNTVIFTAESFNVEFQSLTMEQMRNLLHQFVGKGSFTMHYLSPYYGAWRDADFYVAEGSMEVGTIEDGGERWDSLSFSVVGVDVI